MSALLSVSQVGLQFGDRPILQDVTTSVQAGEIIGIIGPNGAGKSSLLKVLAGLLVPMNGEVRFDQKALQEWRENERARRIGYLAQSASAHWPLSVRTVVELGRLPWRRGWFARDSAGSAAVDRALSDADLIGLQHRLVTELSGGEYMRAMIARVLAAEPELILADEPVAALDVHHQLHVMELLRQRAANGVTVMLVLHDLTLASRFCSRLILLEQGRIVMQDSPQAVLNSEALERVYRVQMKTVEPEPGHQIPIPWQRLS